MDVPQFRFGPYDHGKWQLHRAECQPNRKCPFCGERLFVFVSVTVFFENDLGALLRYKTICAQCFEQELEDKLQDLKVKVDLKFSQPTSLKLIDGRDFGGGGVLLPDVEVRSSSDGLFLPRIVVIPDYAKQTFNLDYNGFKWEISCLGDGDMVLIVPGVSTAKGAMKCALRLLQRHRLHVLIRRGQRLDAVLDAAESLEK